MAKAAASSPADAGTAAGSALDPLDLYGVRASLSDEERMVQESVARLVDAEVLPIIQQCFEEHRFPKELIPKLAAQGLLGSSIQGYECAGLNAVCYGLICQELDPLPRPAREMATEIKGRGRPTRSSGGRSTG